ncbi:MAG: L-2-amino-thiazoline-4-carboxylic acid hydrolase [Ruminococcus sp.]|nr:L-2-amino-thiazoline-4-carboxylic acid hydrolase [Ruminococcus sp.]
MKNKRQEEIRAFLVSEFGEREGGMLFEKQSSLFHSLLERTKGKSKSQMKTLSGTVMPVIALYRVTAEHEKDKEKALKIVGRYMTDIVGVQKNESMARMEKVPGFFFIYKKIFLKVMRTSDLWISTQECGNEYFNVTITKCLWHSACVENGCPELCRLFCDVDDVTYGELKKLKFTRTTSLGCDGDCCDFRFLKK